jgi:hypothetical protein
VKSDRVKSEIFLEVLVKPGSREPSLVEENGLTVIRVRERAVDGAANAAVVRALAAAYGVPPSAVELLRGITARRKRIAIRR